MQLVAKYGEDQPLRVLYNPDDFRHVFIYEGDDAPLVTLEHEFLRPETPAWTFTEAKERLKELRANSKRAPQSERFQQDLHEQIVNDSLMQKRKQPSKRERNRETAQREKEAKAISRAATPLPPPIGNAGRNATKGATPSITDTVPLDEVALLPVLDRSKGGPL